MGDLEGYYDYNYYDKGIYLSDSKVNKYNNEYAYVPNAAQPATQQQLADQYRKAGNIGQTSAQAAPLNESKKSLMDSVMRPMDRENFTVGEITISFTKMEIMFILVVVLLLYLIHSIRQNNQVMDRLSTLLLTARS